MNPKKNTYNYLLQQICRSILLYIGQGKVTLCCKENMYQIRRKQDTEEIHSPGLSPLVNESEHWLWIVLIMY